MIGILSIGKPIISLSAVAMVVGEETPRRTGMGMNELVN